LSRNRIPLSITHRYRRRWLSGWMGQIRGSQPAARNKFYAARVLFLILCHLHGKKKAIWFVLSHSQPTACPTWVAETPDKQIFNPKVATTISAETSDNF
jgi:hypothetical protein